MGATSTPRTDLHKRDCDPKTSNQQHIVCNIVIQSRLTALKRT